MFAVMEKLEFLNRQGEVVPEWMPLFQGEPGHPIMLMLPDVRKNSKYVMISVPVNARLLCYVKNEMQEWEVYLDGELFPLQVVSIVKPD